MPRLLNWIAARLCRDDDGAALVGDLEQEYGRLRATVGPFRARLWCAREIAAAVAIR
jgi:hypothetical protein